MNTDHIRYIITMLKEDKSCAQPWRNKAIARLEEAKVFIEQGHRITNVSPPGGMESATYTGKDCICPQGGFHKDCPLHGTMV